MTVATSGLVELCLPRDWTELLLPDDDEARDHLDRLVRSTWPGGPAGPRTGSTRALMEWRAAMLDAGVVSHGVVIAPRPEGTPANWHVQTSVVPLPVVPDVDVPAVVAELVRARWGAGPHHVETYETDMGLGVGVVAERTVPPPPGLADLAVRGLEVVADPVRMGVAVALACAPGATQALLVVGVCLDPAQVWELAGLVAVVAGRSRLHPAPAADEGEDRSG
ncbi:hypothetical protein [Blastococcus sp. VKM Ac-2987]|uniref:hypothetical protein n=1 Tax=Blastococcus sp. VKM Ac-2987 TaxID=3004141 RepID=UPI0022AB66AB|nr:hypothetical protein [Blastococcus sp. VKM Ac-2987]MCZ2857870.1 hypothetical protein [Blastococcus sp. VKM Ac-2987]